MTIPIVVIILNAAPMLLVEWPDSMDSVLRFEIRDNNTIRDIRNISVTVNGTEIPFEQDELLIADSSRGRYRASLPPGASSSTVEISVSDDEETVTDSMSYGAGGPIFVPPPPGMDPIASMFVVGIVLAIILAVSSNMPEEYAYQVRVVSGLVFGVAMVVIILEVL